MLRLAALGLLFGAGVDAFSTQVRQNVRSNFGSDRMIALPISEITDNIYSILSEFGADDLGRQDGAMHFKLSPSAVSQLDDEGTSFLDLTEEFITNMEVNLNSENFVCTDGAEACAASDSFYSSYQEYDSIHAKFQGLADANADIADLATLGFSHEGREQKLLLIGDQTLPLVYYFCTIHAREWIVPMFCTFMAETLLDQNNPVSRDLLSRFSFAITPIANPDGYIYTFEEDNAWRKTRVPNPTSSCVGTDPNRNWATGWGGEGSSKDPCSNTYSGTAPFNQPCVVNVRNFIDTNKNRIIHINDVHSYGEYWLAPYGYTSNPPSDINKHNEVGRAVYDAILANSGTRWKVGPTATTIYVASGISLDYLVDELGITHAYTYEARGAGPGIGGFQPPPSFIMPSNIEMFAGMVAALEVIERQEVRGQVPEPFEVPEADEEAVESQATDLTPLVGAVVFLGMVVAAMGSVLGVVIFKLKKREQAVNPDL